MYRRAISVVLAGLFVAGLVAATYLVAKPPPEKVTVTLLYPKGPTDQLLWPTKNSWVWSVNRLGPAASGDCLSLEARVVHQRLGKNER
jgi:hypothetical protein